MALERCVQALIAHDAASADSLSELLSLDSIFFTFGTVGGVKERAFAASAGCGV
jgi:hypothetical protein